MVLTMSNSSWIIILPFLILNLICGEVIKLQNKDHVLCVTDDEISTIYVDPPVVTNSKDDSVLIENEDIYWNDWLLKTSLEVIVPTVTDKRWEDFSTIYTVHVHYDSVSSIALSTYGRDIDTLIREPVKKREKRSELDQSWHHGSSFPSINSNLSSDNYHKFQYDGRSKKHGTYWKIHNYKVRWADNISETPTTLSVSTADDSCLMFYAYTCSECRLNLTVSSKSGERKHIIDTSKKWELEKINTSIPFILTLSRYTTNGRSNGQWAVDIRRCPIKKSGKIIHEELLAKDFQPNTNRSCELFFSFRRTYGKQKYANNIFSCPPGRFGKKCDAICEEILGSEMKYCEEHQICDDSTSNQKCVCAWGYHGSSCNQTCPSGQWGLSCQNNCVSCDTCNEKTGECNSSISNAGLNMGVLVIIAIFSALA